MDRSSFEIEIRVPDCDEKQRIVIHDVARAEWNNFVNTLEDKLIEAYEKVEEEEEFDFYEALEAALSGVLWDYVGVDYEIVIW